MKQEISKRIKQRRQELKLSQSDVANHIGVNRVSVSNWETEKNSTTPKGENLLLLAEILKVTPQWIINGKEEDLLPPSRGNEIEFIGGFDLWDDHTPLRDDEVKLPIYTDVELSAGVGSCFVLETNGRYIRFSKKTLRDNNVDKHAAACARISGNSMEPVLADGTTVGIDTSKKEIKDGRLYAINHAGMLRIKLLYNIPGGGIRIRSYNATEYPDEIITDPAKLEQIEVVGFVFWWSTLNKW